MSIAFPDRPAAESEPALDAWFTPWRFALLLLVFLCAAYPDIMFGWNTFYFRDYGFFGYPLAHYHRESFWHGEIPLWNPLSNLGLPFLAQWNTLVLYPGSLIYLLFPISWSLGAYCLGHLFLAGMAMYWLAHHWTGNRLAASVAGLAFAFNGLSLNCLMWPNNVAALAWMPLVVLYVPRAWREGGHLLVVAAMAGAIQMLAGAPEIVLFTWFVVGVIGVHQIISGAAPRGKILWRGSLVMLLIGGLTAAQMLPFIDLLRHSQRSAGFANADWAMPETGWANLIVPLFHTYQNRQGVHFQYGQYWTSSYYLGIGVLALAIYGAWQVRERRVWLLLGITLLSFILALGDDGHLYRWLRNLFPQFGFMRFPIKFVVLAVFSVPLLAAFGVRKLQELTPADAPSAWKKLFFVAGVLLVLSGGIVWFGYHFRLVEEKWSVTLFSAWTRAAFLILILGLLFGLRLVQRTQSRLLARVVLLAALAFDAFTHAPRQNPTVPRAALEPGMADFEKMAPKPAHGKSRAMLTPEADMKLRYAFTSKPLNDYIVSRLGLFSNCNLLEGIPKVNGFYSLYQREAAEVWSLIYTTTNGPPTALYDFLGVSQITRPGEYFEWTNRPSFMPLATTGQRAVFAADPTALQLIAATNFNPRTVVYLPTEAQRLVTATNQTQAEVIASEFTAHDAKIEVRSEAPTMLVVAQAFYHPWQAYVDGQRTTIWRANYGFQAIQVPAGQHSVRLDYEDKQFVRGAIISISTLALCLVFWLGCRWRNQRREELRDKESGEVVSG